MNRMIKRFEGDIIITDPCYIMRAKHHGTTPITKDDWDTCSYGRAMEALGINTYLTNDTIYGDWSCTTFNKDNMHNADNVKKELNTMYMNFFAQYNDVDVYKTEENRNAMYKEYTKARNKVEADSGVVLGHFCADAGMVSVFLLEEVLKYNPDFDYHINKPWTTTWIKNFSGEVEIQIVEIKGEDVVQVVGTGNINFYTSQTGF